MPAQERRLHGVMQGGGAYNAHALLQASGQTLALPLLDDAVQQIPLEASDKPVVIAETAAASEIF